MNTDFNLFDVYLGTHKRKEDFFTYYLASCLDFICKTDKGIFKKILIEVFHLSEIGNFKILDWQESKKFLKKNCQPKYNDELKILREFPLPKSNDDATNYYLDLAFFIRKENQTLPTFIGVEGKVYDSSVKPGQLERYHKSIQSILNDHAIVTDLFLLSTVNRRSDTSKSEAAIEITRYIESELASKSASLILWNDFYLAINNCMSDKYFNYAFKDAFKQLKQNAKSDKVPKEYGKSEMFSLFKHLDDEEFQSNFQDLVGSEVLKLNTDKANPTFDFVIKDKSLGEQESFINCLDLLFKNKNNLKRIKKKTQFEHKTLERQLLLKYSADTKDNILNDLKTLKSIDIKTDFVKNKIEMAQIEAENIVNQSTEQIIIEEFLKRVRADNDFYENIFFNADFIKSDYFCFFSAAKKNIGKLGIRIELKKKFQNRYKISLMTLKKDRIEFEQQK